MIERIRSIIFDICFAFVTIFFAIFGFPLGISKKYSPILGKAWAETVLFLLEKICKIKSICKDIDKISACNLVLSKHQSAWETIFFLAKIKNVTFVIKEELTKIPFYGWYLKNMGAITVKRKISPSELKSMNKKIKDAILDGKTVVIFPQGTRTNPDLNNCEISFKLNCLEIFKTISGKVALIGLNSGTYFPKGFMKAKKSGNIVASLADILHIEKKECVKMDKNEILKLKNEIAKKIEDESRALLVKHC